MLSKIRWIPVMPYKLMRHASKFNKIMKEFRDKTINLNETSVAVIQKKNIMVILNPWTNLTQQGKEILRAKCESDSSASKQATQS